MEKTNQSMNEQKKEEGNDGESLGTLLERACRPPNVDATGLGTLLDRPEAPALLCARHLYRAFLRCAEFGNLDAMTTLSKWIHQEPWKRPNALTARPSRSWNVTDGLEDIWDVTTRESRRVATQHGHVSVLTWLIQTPYPFYTPARYRSESEPSGLHEDAGAMTGRLLDAMKVAVQYGHVTVLDGLKAAFSDPDAASRYNGLLFDAIEYNQPEVARWLLKQPQVEWTEKHHDRLFHSIKGSDHEELMLVVLHHATLQPIQAFDLFRRACGYGLERVIHAIFDRYESEHITDWLRDEWPHVVLWAHIRPSIAERFLDHPGFDPSGDRQYGLINSTAAWLTERLLNDPRVDPTVDFETILFLNAGMRPFEREQRMALFLRDKRIQAAMAKRSYDWLSRVWIPLGSMDLLDRYLSVSTHPIDLLHVWNARTYQSLAIARRLLASARFTTCSDRHVPRVNRANVPWLAWLHDLSNACLRITPAEWRWKRRCHGNRRNSEQTRYLMNPHRDAGSTECRSYSGVKRSFSEISAEEFDLMHMPCKRPRLDEETDVRRDHAHSVWYRAMDTVRPWIMAIDRALCGPDPYDDPPDAAGTSDASKPAEVHLPSDLVHGLVVDYVLGPEYEDGPTS